MEQMYASDLQYKKNLFLLVLLVIGLFSTITILGIPWLYYIVVAFIPIETWYLYIFLPLGIYIISTIAVYIDSKKICAGRLFKKEKLFVLASWKPRSWAIATLPFWFAIFPIYIINRKEIFIVNKFAPKTFAKKGVKIPLEPEKFIVTPWKATKTLSILWILITVVLPTAVSPVREYRIEHPDGVVYVIEISSDKYNTNDLIRYNSYIVNKNFCPIIVKLDYGYTSTQHEKNVSIPMVESWRDGLILRLEPLKKEKFSSGDYVANQLLHFGGTGKYFVRGVVHCTNCNQHELESEIVSFEIVEEG